MPRGRKPATNPFAEGSAESVEWEEQQAAKREAVPAVPATERRLTITVSVESIQAAKSLAILSGTTYREVLALAATHGVEGLTNKVRAALLAPEHSDILSD
jgi:hypothetical protein